MGLQENIVEKLRHERPNGTPFAPAKALSLTQASLSISVFEIKGAVIRNFAAFPISYPSERARTVTKPDWNR